QHGLSDVFSIGRVQTPTLALIVERERQIESFQSVPFWELHATFAYAEGSFVGKWHRDGESKIMDADLAKRMQAFCEGKSYRIVDVEEERKKFPPPLLYALNGLQKDANVRFKYSPQQTLDIAQKLYTKGHISYPRSDSSWITKEEAKTLPAILQGLSNIPGYAGFFPLPIQSIENNRRYTNEKKVTDHYAIIPTESIPNIDRLPAEERNLYDLIVKRVIAAHCHDAIFDYTAIHTIVDERATFLSKGRVMVEEGWRKVLNQKDRDEEEANLPKVVAGETERVQETTIVSKKTEPPKRFTEGDLIAVMKHCGRALDDEELSSVLKKTEGLGTEATRAGIIAVLKQRKYIDVQKNLVYATPKGKLLITALGESILASPLLTAKWEQR
ncbi:MAG: DNA topoisomerase, partial [Bacilli bacterium]